MCKKVMWSKTLLTFGINYRNRTNYPSYIFTFIIRRGFEIIYLKSFVLREYMFHSLSPEISISDGYYTDMHLYYGYYCALDKINVNLEF